MDSLEPAMIPVESSVFSALGYDDATRTLFARFRSGALYAYLQAPPAVWEAWRAAPSKGGFFAERVDPVFPYVRLAG